MTTWTTAIETIKKPSLSNREASGLVNLARAALRSFGGKLRDVKVDWYQLALWALDYFKPGDKFKIDTAHQLAPYPNPLELWEQLNGLAKQLDDAGVEFRQPTTIDPRGTPGGFRQLAHDAWELMKLRRAQSKTPPEDTMPVLPQPTTPPPTTTPPTTNGGGGSGIALLLLLFLFASGKGRR